MLEAISSRYMRCSRCSTHSSRAEGIQSSSLIEWIDRTKHDGPTSESRTLDPCTKPPHLGGIPPEAPSARAKEDTRSETGDEQTYLSCRDETMKSGCVRLSSKYVVERGDCCKRRESSQVEERRRKKQSFPEVRTEQKRVSRV